MKRKLPKYSKERVALVDRIDKQFDSIIDRLQRQLYEAVRDYFEQELIIVNNEVRSISRNYAAINRIGIVADQFKQKEVSPFMSWMARRFVDVLKVNTLYFGAQQKLKEKNVRDKVYRKALAQIGVTQKKDSLIIQKGGWLDGISELQDPYTRVKEIGINAVANRMPFENFRKQLKEGVTGNNARTLRAHFKTNAYDSYAQFDRMTAREYAVELQMRAFIYTGGLIDDSRDFCVQRNDKVITIEEAEKWRNMQWPGKNKDYEPLRDFGGYNCRHHNAPISDERAIQLRPELKEIWGN